MKIHAVLLSLMLFGFLHVSAFSQDLKPEAVTVYYYERMPFFGNVGQPDEGFILKITRLIFEDAGIAYTFEKAPVARIFENLKSYGPYCVAGGFKTPERERQYLYSREAIYQDGSPHYIIRRSDQNKFNSVTTIESLLRNGMVLGRVDTYSYGRWIDLNIELFSPRQITVNIGDDQNSFFKMLMIGRFDYLFSGEEESVYNISMNEEYRNKLMIKNLSDAPAGNIRWLILSRAFPPEQLIKINNSIVKVKKSSAYRKIIAEAKKRPQYNSIILE
jgi:polar amino acid transport system substrate-binding protein